MVQLKVKNKTGKTLHLDRMGQGSSLQVTGVTGVPPALGDVVDATISGDSITMKHSKGTAKGTLVQN